MGHTPKREDVKNEMCHTAEDARLFQAVMRQIGSDWQTVYQYPMDFRTADAGIPGFITYNDTLTFAQKNVTLILEQLWELEDELGEPLKKPQNIGPTAMWNWLAWFALENNVQKVIDYKEQNGEE